VDELDGHTRRFYDLAQKLIDKLKIEILVSPLAKLDGMRYRRESAGYSFLLVRRPRRCAS